MSRYFIKILTSEMSYRVNYRFPNASMRMCPQFDNSRDNILYVINETLFSFEWNFTSFFFSLKG